MGECIFCKIIDRESRADILFESEELLGIAPIDPIAKGHTLLMPKRHFKDVFDIDRGLLERLMGSAQAIAKGLVEEHGATGVNLLHASGRDAQQSVMHFHLHIVPRHPGDGLNLWLEKQGQ